jgi:hypothetical protein
MIHTFEAAYARIEELSKQVEALTNEKYQLIVERDEARAELLVQDAISAMGAKWLVDLTSLRIKYERQRRTIRALVVAARVARLAAVGFAFIAGVGPTRVHDEIRFGIKQADRQAKE